MFMSEWEDGADTMIEGMYDLLNEADVIVGFNSDKFDVKRLNAEFIERGWAPPSPYDKIDLFKQAKKHFAWSSNRLKDILKRLELTPKLEDTIDMELWIDCCYWKDSAAQNRMKKYNKQDVRSTEELYEWLLGWIEPHPNWALFADDVTDPDKPVCPNCGGTHLHKVKVRRTRVRSYQQWHCQDCGKYSRGRKNLGLKGTDNGILL
jgi:hypothetical protein